jgi:hypothetical protein
MSSVPKEIDSLLLIADISGYTKFMLSNRQSIKHSQTIITELTKTIIQQVKIPFLVSKLEGILRRNRRSEDSCILSI